VTRHLPVLLGGALSIGLSAALLAQAPDCGPRTADCGLRTPQQAPTFQATTQLVQVDARVFDRDGRFVSDLTLEDFEIVEQGQVQPLQALYLVDGGTGPTASAAPLVSMRGSTVEGAPPPAATRQTWIFVFDLNHLTAGGGFDRARTAVTTFLKEQFRDGDLGGIVAGSTMVNNRLTSVRAELADAAATVRPNNDHRQRMNILLREWPRIRDESEALAIASGDREAIQRATLRAAADDPSAGQNADLMVRAKAEQFRTDMTRSSLDTLTALHGLATGLARIPGPKTVVLLSDGFVAQELGTTLRSVVGQITRAGARVYAIDARGLNRGTNASIGDQMLVDSSQSAPARFDIGEDSPNSLAVDTGGFFIRNQNNVGRALTTIAEDANRYYVIGYQPQGLTLDGQYRPIEVRVTRPGVTVRARRGYLALPTASLLDPQPIKRIE